MAKKAYELLALAHEYYQSPLQHQDLTGRNRLPDEDITQLLKILNESGKNPASLHNISNSLETTTDKLRYASLFFIKRLLFSGHRDYYQVLGIPKNATPHLIKNQYRLLIGLFHPDKNPDGEQWHKDYSPLINEAYNTLKKPESRATYDRHIKASSSPPTSRNNYRKKPWPTSTSKSKPWLWITRLPKLLHEIPGLYRFPKIITWSITFVTVITILLYSQFQKQVEFLKIADEDQDPPALTTNITQKKSFSIPKELNSIQKQPAPDNELLERTLKSENLEKLLSNDNKPNNNSSVSITKNISDISSNYVTKPVPESVKNAQPEKPAVEINKQINKGGSDDRVATLPDDQIQHGSARRSSEILFMRYIRGYEAGDISQILEIFSPDVITNQGQGKKLAEASYRQLFKNTRNRKLILKEVFIQPESKNAAHIISDVEIVVLYKNENISRRYVGQIFLWFAPSHEKLQIVQLLHKVKRKDT